MGDSVDEVSRNLRWSRSGSTTSDCRVVGGSDIAVRHFRDTTTMWLSAISNDPYERDMIKFVVIWSDYGGGPSSQIFEDFGLCEREFFRRVFLLVAGPTADLALGGALARRLQRICLARLRGRDCRSSRPE
jgi:hypothetical protein